MPYLKKTLFCLLLALLGSLEAAAQFYYAGDDPARSRWNSIESENFRIIYPVGLDSLARVYGQNLEYYRPKVAQSVHYFSGPGKMPVVLHPYTSYSNGSVAWAPRRMDLYTQAEAYNPIPLDWVQLLSIHESRHVSQMQFGLSHALKPFGWFFGEMFNGLSAGVYGHYCFMEGDAVCTETALTRSGRGRKADFLNYYMIAFDNGDRRSLYRWSHDSQTRNTPDHYALGYLLLGGIRYLYGVPDFVGQFYEYAARHPYNFKYTTVLKNISGLNLSKTFDAVCDTMTVIWKAEMCSRAPYTPMRQVSHSRRGYPKYSHLTPIGDELYAVKSSLYEASSLVRIDSLGREKRLRPSASYRGPSAVSGGKAYWSETLSGPRWSLEDRSVIRYSSGRRPKTLAKGLYNPTVSPDGKLLAAVCYPLEGGCTIEILDSLGRGLESQKAPQGVQFSELAWSSKGIFAIGISSEGSGIYQGGHCILGPEPVSITSLGAASDGSLIFTCDRTGVNEMYSLTPDGRLFQRTSTRYGAKDFRYSEDGSSLYCISGRLEGEHIFQISADSLLMREADFSELHSYVVADTLSAQEERYNCPPPSKPEFSEPKRYHKAAHLMNIHSWAPVYFDVDNLMALSGDISYRDLSLGTAFVSQNLLGTLTLNAGYSAHKYDGSWRHSGHLKLRYTGWYPVIEASLDINDRPAIDYGSLHFEGSGVSLPSHYSSRPYVAGNISIYIPFKWNLGGVSYGLIPEISYSISNDRINTGGARWNNDPLKPGIAWIKKGPTWPLQSLSASLRGYIMRPTASGGVYPRFGIGLQTGFSQLITPKWDGRSVYKPALYVYGYGYLPGVIAEQGLKLSARYQHSFTEKGLFGRSAITVLPRGFGGSSLSLLANARQSWAAGFTLDYAAPIPLGDLSIGRGVLDLKRLILTPHYDMTFNSDGKLWSAGGSLAVDVGGILWHTLSFSIGVTYSYNGGSAYSYYLSKCCPLSRHYVGPIISASF